METPLEKSLGLTTEEHVESRISLSIIANALIIASQTTKKDKPCPIISLGSGNAMCERVAINIARNKKLTIITVDPTPSSFYHTELAKDTCPLLDGKPSLYCQSLFPETYTKEFKADYPSVQDLVNAKPELVGQCTLFLPWCNPNNFTADFEAIQLLQPASFLILYERPPSIPECDPSGASGGKMMHKFISLMLDGTGPYKLIKEHLKVGKTKDPMSLLIASMLALTTRNGDLPEMKDSMTQCYYRLEWWVERGTGVKIPSTREW